MPESVNEWQKHHPWESSPRAHPQAVPLVKPSDLFNYRQIGGGMGGVREDEQQYDMGAEI